MPLMQSERHCSNCARPMQVLDLSGHYQHRVQVDTCQHCCLVWFDDTESVRLAGPGIAEFVREIHGAMQAGEGHDHAISLSRIQTCPVCQSALKTVYNRTRFGRTRQMECPEGHGYYQTYILYLAEKGFVRPLAWSDIHSLLAAGKHLFCADCGHPLPNRPIAECPACRSAIEVIDPTRLAMAIDRIDAPLAPPGPAAAALDQYKCHGCGGAVDQTREIYCPHCHAPVLRHDTADAATAAAHASELAQAAARAQRMRQEASASAAHALAEQRAMNAYIEGQRGQWAKKLESKVALGILLAALGFIVYMRRHFF